ncbi:hypothetical protein L1049_017400 [Liquidambar formosana]|uniref:Phytocyanin domain-containing protein n=1 Tax=Liquidambar formosana TaxID=63359 RepID=A0AAP0S331_LIQFO
MGKSVFMLLLIGVVAAVMLQCAAAQTVHVVGWVIPPAFNFTTNEENVLEVSKASYDACSSTNPIGTTITNGPANITLTSAGEHYYICTFGQHCLNG